MTIYEVVKHADRQHLVQKVFERLCQNYDSISELHRAIISTHIDLLLQKSPIEDPDIVLVLYFGRKYMGYEEWVSCDRYALVHQSRLHQFCTNTVLDTLDLYERTTQDLGESEVQEWYAYEVLPQLKWEWDIAFSARLLGNSLRYRERLAIDLLTWYIAEIMGRAKEERRFVPKAYHKKIPGSDLTEERLDWMRTKVMDETVGYYIEIKSIVNGG